MSDEMMPMGWERLIKAILKTTGPVEITEETLFDSVAPGDMIYIERNEDKFTYTIGVTNEPEPTSE